MSMLGVLLESKAVRQRRDGGAALSVATHLAIVGFVAVVTAKPAVHREKDPVTIVRFTPPVVRELPKPRPATPTIPTTGPWSPVPIFPVVTKVPTSIPPIDLAVPNDPTPNEIAFGDPRSGIGRLGGADFGGGEPKSRGNAEWNGTETMMRLVVSAKPRYPERLRIAGVNGRVLIRFVVDTTGRVDVAAVQILESTHDLFITAVRDILPALRFKPSEANGQRVRSLAEMAFEFQITR